jgi:signal peptidase II
MTDKAKIAPFLLTAAIILLDQIVKSFIAANWPVDEGSNGVVFIKDVFDNELIWIIHVRNKAIAFSIGHNLPEVLRPALFVVLPIIVLGFLIWYYMKSQEFSTLQRWVVGGIIGGGIGNIIDRIFRPEGVVDFISVKFFGIQELGGPLAFLSWDRWPTFNIADASVVVCGIILLITIFISSNSSKPEDSL